MKLRAILLALYAGLLLNCAFVLLFGETGLLRYEHLDRRRALLAENLESLERINKDLEQELATLRSDAETIRLLARELGYYRPAERTVQVAGVPRPQLTYTVGRLVAGMQSHPIGGSSSWRVPIFFAPLAAYVTLGLLRRIFR